jgi:hypothetical protein
MQDKMEKGNSVYIKLEYDNTLQSEKDILSSEVFFLNLVTLRKKYNLLKMEEMIIKTKIKRSLNKMNASIKKVENSFPEVNLPRRKRTETIVAVQKEKIDENLDVQLMDIQEKLRALNNV